METWKDIPGYEGRYQVSDLGRIRSRNKVLKLSTAGSQYKRVRLRNSGVNTFPYVHRLVASAFIGPCTAGCEVCHGPAGRLDNQVSNLSYGTKSDNRRDRKRDGTDGGTTVIRGDGKTYASVAEAAADTGVSRSGVSKVCRGITSKAGGYTWKYLGETNA